MIIKRISQALRAQDWPAVAIEFVIVVLGIFVALQAQNWNQERLDRQLEQVYITRLADETRSNLKILNQHERIFAAKVQFILDLPELALEDRVRHDPQAFMSELDNSSYVGLPDLRSETYRELESSGRLALLRDTELRSSIAGNLNDYRSYRPLMAQQIGGYRRMLFETLPGRSFSEFRAGTGAVDVAAVVAAVDKFRGDHRFEAAANAEVAYGADALFWIRVFRQQTEEILSRLDAGA